MSPSHTGTRPAGQARRRNNPRGEGARLRDDLVDAACALLTETGDAGQLSIRAVAAKTGVAATSVYLHFADLDEIRVAVAERSFADLATAREAAVTGLDDPCAVLVARCLAYAHFGLSHPGQYRLMFGAALPATVFARFYNATGSASRGAYESMTDAIQRCQQARAGHDDADPVLLAAILWPALHGQVLLRLDRPDFPRPALDDVITETVHRLLGFHRIERRGN
ncbi:MAG: TetR/AcrR family transcriptional regulator [Candidatus Dormibacteraceae bacterium]